jgi:hypothetical protein
MMKAKTQSGLVQLGHDHSNTRIWPEVSPFPSFLPAPIAILLPSEERDTFFPDKSRAASPSMSLPTCDHWFELSNLYTRTWPEASPFPSFLCAPIAIMLPSEERDTEIPDLSPAASPSMSLPTCVH